MHDVLLPLPLWWRGPSWGSWDSFSCSWWRRTPPSVPHIPPPGSAKTLRPAGMVSCSSDPMPESGYRDAHRVDNFLRYDIYRFRMIGSKVVCYLHSSELHHRTDPLWNHVEVLCSLWGNQRKIWLPRLQRQEKSWVPELFWDTVKGACSPLLWLQTLSWSISSAATSASPALCPFWMMGCHRSLGFWSMLGFNFTIGTQTVRPSCSSFPYTESNMAQTQFPILC